MVYFGFLSLPSFSLDSIVYSPSLAVDRAIHGYHMYDSHPEKILLIDENDAAQRCSCAAREKAGVTDASDP